MSGKKNMWVTLGFVISASLIAAAVSVLFVSYYYSRLQFDLLNAVCVEVMEQEPETGKIITAALKVYAGGNPDGAVEKDVLSALGYRISDFSGSACGQNILSAAMGFMTGILLFIFTFMLHPHLSFFPANKYTEKDLICRLSANAS